MPLWLTGEEELPHYVFVFSFYFKVSLLSSAYLILLLVLKVESYGISCHSTNLQNWCPIYLLNLSQSSFTVLNGRHGKMMGWWCRMSWKSCCSRMFTVAVVRIMRPSTNQNLVSVWGQEALRCMFVDVLQKWCPLELPWDRVLCFSFHFTGVSVTSSNTGVPDISGSVYTKTQVSIFLCLLASIIIVASRFVILLPYTLCKNLKFPFIADPIL